MSTKYVSVTPGQADWIRKVANEKGIGRARLQQAMDDGSLGHFLDSLKPIRPLIELPMYGRTHILKVRVDQGCTWETAMSVVSNTARNNRFVFEGSPCSVGKGIVKRELVLLHYVDFSTDWSSAIGWADNQGLKRTDLRSVIALCQQYPQLHQLLGGNPVCVVATKDFCTAGYSGHLTYGVEWDWDGGLQHLEHNVCLHRTRGLKSHFNQFDIWYAFCKK